MGKRTISGPATSDQSISVRKIENGFIISKSSYGPKSYKSTETFSPTKPNIEIGCKPKTRPGGSKSVLSRAISHTRGK